MEPVPFELSPALSHLLDRLTDQPFAAKLRKVYLAGALAIGKLSDIDLVKYEVGSGDESPDLSLWEEMAPVIRDTVMAVNGLLFVIREQFVVAKKLSLVQPPAAIPNALPVDPRKTQQISTMLENGMNQIAQQITDLGELMRNPQVVSDRWSLLAELQRFRTRFREEIGDLVYDSVSVLDDVRREDVEPGYAQALQSALNVRATVADLRRVMEARLKAIREAQPEDVQWNAQQLEKELDLFGRTPAYGALRAQDKRAVIEFRHSLGELAKEGSRSKLALLALMEPFAERVKSLDKVSKRQMLMSHDHEVLAACGVRLEHAEQHLAKDPAGAARGLAEAALTAQSLYGRDAELDAFLRKSRKTSLSSLAGAELKQHLEQLRTLLANLSL